MHVLVLTERFHPEISAPSVRIVDHARSWIAKGHQVTVVTSAPNAPRGEVFDGYQNRLFSREDVDGITVIRLWSYMAPNQGFVRRVADWLSLAVMTVLAAPWLPKCDVILATSPPIFTPVAGVALSWIKWTPWLMEVRDLWPASIRAVGASNNRFLLWSLERMELWLYARAQKIVVVTEAFRRDLSERGVPSEKIDIVRNAADLGVFDPEAVTEDGRALLGLPRDRFIAGYVGTTGMAHGLDNLLDAASLLKAHSKVLILILGEGAEREGLEARAKARGLDNVVFRDFMPHTHMPAILTALDASIVHLRPDPLWETVIPSKIFEGMAMGVPLIHCVRGESASIVGDAGAGRCVPPGEPEALAAAILELYQDPELGAQLATAGRAAAVETHNRASTGAALMVSLQSTLS